MTLASLPHELLTRILFDVDQKTLTSSCSMVCTLWKTSIEDIGFWKRYHLFWCQRLHQCNIPEEVYHSGLSWSFFAQLNPRKNNFGKNLIRNGGTELVEPEELLIQNQRVNRNGSMQPWPVYPFWDIESNDGEGWKVERPAIGRKNLKLPIIPKENVKESYLYLPGCYVTSYWPCCKEQTVDLIEAGFQPEILDNPDYLFEVHVEKWYTRTGPSNWVMAVTCLDHNKKIVRDSDARASGPKVPNPNPSQYGLWQRKTISFKMSLSGFRYIQFFHGGGALKRFPDESISLIKVKMAGARMVISYPSLNILL